MQIRLNLRPAGPTCNHVELRTITGRVIEVTTIANLRSAPDRKSDSPLLIQIKRIARDSGITDPQLLRAELETHEFDP